jgi:hypothetical protein
LNEEYPKALTYTLSDLIILNLDIEVAKTAEGYSEAIKQQDVLNECRKRRHLDMVVSCPGY